MKYFNSDFTIGIELEAFAKISEFIDINEYNCEENVYCNYLNDYNYEPEDGEYNPLEEFYNNIRNFFKREFGLSGNVHYDGSVKGFKNGYNGFEWSSPIIKYTPKEMCQLKSMLKSLTMYDIHTNESCGFHTHFSYKNINESDVLWLIMNIAMSDEYVNTFTEFCYNEKCNDYPLLDLYEMKYINFSNERYANKEYLSRLKDAIVCKQYDAVSMILNCEKYRVLRIHPQGTIEWRGPRGFLQSNAGIDAYFRKLYKVISIFQSILQKDTLMGMTKNEWLNIISEHSIKDMDTYYSLPERTSKHKKCDTYGILSDFLPNSKMTSNLHHYSNKARRFINPIQIICDDIIKNPLLINDKSFSHLLPLICDRLAEMDKFRWVIEKNVHCGHKLSLNVQYCMIKKNITLIPYTTEDVWKYISLSKLKSFVFRNGSFSVKSEYKLQTLDFWLTKLPQLIGYDETMLFWCWFIDRIDDSSRHQWVRDYLYTKKDEYVNIIKNNELVCNDEYSKDVIKHNVEKIDNFRDLHRFLYNFYKVILSSVDRVSIVQNFV